MYNYVVLKVTNVHQVKVNEHGESEWNTRSRSFSGLLHRSILSLLISISYIIHLINFSKVQIFLLIYAMYNVMILICRVRIFV